MRRFACAGAVTSLLVSVVVVAPATAAETSRVEIVADGLDGPRGLDVGPDGMIYVTESGTGGDAFCDVQENPETGESSEACVGPTSGITTIAPDGTVTRNAVPGISSMLQDETAVGASDVTVAADGSLYISVGLGGDEAKRDMFAAEWAPASMFSTVQRWDGESLTTVFDAAAWEAENDPNAGQPSTGPDGEPSNDSNADAVLAVDGSLFVADAGGNWVVEVDTATQEATLAAFLPDRFAPLPEFFGAPEGTEVPMQSVPTSLTESPAGAVQVGELTGFPFPIGGAHVAQLDSDTSPGVVGEGFTNVMDLGYRGSELFVLEIAHHSLLAAEDGGALVRVRPDGSRIALLRDVLFMPGGMAVGPDGMIYITNLSVVPGGGQVLRFDPSQAADPATQAACPPDEVPGAGLSDIADTTHEEAITCTAWWGLFEGAADGTFATTASISRGQFASVVADLVRAAGGDLSASDDAFTDDDGTTHEANINALAAVDIVGGFGDGRFQPNIPVDRAQAASIIVAAYDYVSNDALDSSGDTYADDDTSRHESSIQAASNAGWMKGTGDGAFSPDGDITRGQVASVLARVASSLVGQGAMSLPS